MRSVVESNKQMFYIICSSVSELKNIIYMKTATAEGAELEKVFDLTVNEGSILKFLNICIVQSPAGISFDQTNHFALSS